MKYVWRTMIGIAMLAASLSGSGQSKSGDERMDQDIEVAENILGTLLRQHFGRRNFFPMDVSGTYMPGYGVTFRIPLSDPFVGVMIAPKVAWSKYEEGMSRSYSYSYSEDSREAQRKAKGGARQKTPQADTNNDSLSEVSTKAFMEVSKLFLADYGDILSGLKADERITITNRHQAFDGGFDMMWVGKPDGGKRSMLSVEAKRDDIGQLKQGKISRAEFMNRLKVLNTESMDALDPDLEVFSSMISRLYREDLSNTYYAQGNINYERLKDFGVVYYMKVYSSMEEDENKFAMPTQDVHDLSKDERDKRVKELYPKFESSLKENLVEYGRTLRSIKDEEQVVLNVRLTRCEKCGIPATVEASIKGSALKDYNSGKATKEATLAKVTVKKTGVQ